MSKIAAPITVVLSAKELICEHQPSEYLYEMVGVTTKELVEMFIGQWDTDYDYQFFGGQFEDPHTVPRLSARLMVMDLIFGEFERRQDSEGVVRPPFTTEDRVAVEFAMSSLWASVALSIFQSLETMHVTNQQLQGVQFERWTGNDLVLSIPAA
ncbi:hypothetical protein LUCX_52 [Xanthomonas phage vB_XciM_LucasX]|nr:hypothetical protein LUCX_52 [Xanthomonas phage vB_XciM_LucasX]